MINILIILNNDYCKEDNSKKKLNDSILVSNIKNNNLIIFTYDSIPTYKPTNPIIKCLTNKTCTNMKTTTWIDRFNAMISSTKSNKYLNDVIEILNTYSNATNTIGIDYIKYSDGHTISEIDKSYIFIPKIPKISEIPEIPEISKILEIDKSQKIFVKLNKNEYCFWNAYSAFNYHVKLEYNTESNIYDLLLNKNIFDIKYSTGLWEYIIKYISSSIDNEIFTIDDKIITITIIVNKDNRFYVLCTIIFGIIFAKLYEQLNNYKIIFIYNIIDEDDIKSIVEYITRIIKEKFKDVEFKEYLTNINFNIKKNMDAEIYNYNYNSILQTEQEEIDNNTKTYNIHMAKLAESRKREILENEQFNIEFNKRQSDNLISDIENEKLEKEKMKNPDYVHRMRLKKQSDELADRNDTEDANLRDLIARRERGYSGTQMRGFGYKYMKYKSKYLNISNS